MNGCNKLGKHLDEKRTNGIFIGELIYIASKDEIKLILKIEWLRIRRFFTNVKK